MLHQYWIRDYIRDGSFVNNILSCIDAESYEITSKVPRVSILLDACMSNCHTYIFILQETNLYIELRDHFIGVLMKLPDEDKLKQRVMEILDKREQLLLNEFSGGGRARTSPEWCNSSLVYVSKSKFQGERYVSPQTVASPNTSFFNTELRMSPDAGLSIIYGLKLFSKGYYVRKSAPNWLLISL